MKTGALAEYEYDICGFIPLCQQEKGVSALLDNERGSETQAAVPRPQVMGLNSDFFSLTLFYNRKRECGLQLLT